MKKMIIGLAVECPFLIGKVITEEKGGYIYFRIIFGFLDFIVSIPNR